MARKHPTIKERMFVRKAVELKNLTKAAKEVYNHKNPRDTVKSLMRRPHIQMMFDRLIGDDEVILVLRDQLKATQYNHDLKDYVPDNGARLKAVDMSLKVKGAYPADQKYGIGGSQINFIISKIEGPTPTEVIEGEEADN